MTVRTGTPPTEVIYCLSTDTKPTSQAIGQRLIEYDTGEEFECYDGTNWLKRKVTMITYPTRNRVTATAEYTTKIGDDIIDVNTSGGGVAIHLASDCVWSGKQYTIKDAGGVAGTNVITIDTEGAETIDGAASYVINTNYGSIDVHGDGSNWLIH